MHFVRLVRAIDARLHDILPISSLSRRKGVVSVRTSLPGNKQIELCLRPQLPHVPMCITQSIKLTWTGPGKR